MGVRGGVLGYGGVGEGECVWGELGVEGETRVEGWECVDWGGLPPD